jgi:hypothetical protein
MVLVMLSKTKIIVGLVLLLVFMPVGITFAQYASPNYKVEETFFGAGGELDASSASYQAKVAAGELGIDHSVSSNYQVYSGFNTTDRILLEVYVNGGVFDFGQLSTTEAKAITTTFTVRNYLSSGYIVKIGGTPPKNGSHALCSMGIDSGCLPTVSTPGTEQFGINLAANNLPVPNGPGVFGANPTQVPDSTFGFGIANGDYGISNTFLYIQNSTIALSTKSSGVTQYTLSAIANINTKTPGGTYGTSLSVNAIPTF